MVQGSGCRVQDTGYRALSSHRREAMRAAQVLVTQSFGGLNPPAMHVHVCDGKVKVRMVREREKWETAREADALLSWRMTK